MAKPPSGKVPKMTAGSGSAMGRMQKAAMVAKPKKGSK